MLHGFYYPNDPDGPNLELRYPARAKKGVDLIKVDDLQHAERLWFLRSRRYIFETLRGWTMQRKIAFRHSENHFNNAVANKDHAAERILLMLLSHYESALPLLCLKVKQSIKDIECIAPGSGSRFLSHYEEVIKPMLDWCVEYSDSVYRKKVSSN